MAIGGDITEIKWSHPTLGSGKWYPKAGEDSTFDMGGFRSADDTSMIDGGGNMIDQINRVRPSLEVTIANNLNYTKNQREYQNAIDLAKNAVLGEYIITHISGSVFKLTGKPVGDIQFNANAGTFTVKLSGNSMTQTQ